MRNTIRVTVDNINGEYKAHAIEGLDSYDVEGNGSSVPAAMSEFHDALNELKASFEMIPDNLLNLSFRYKLA